MRKLTHEEIVQRQLANPNQRLPFCVVLNNIRSLYNVGSIFRTADGAGCSKIWICGITGHPPNNQIAKTALGAQDSVPWEYREDSLALIRTLKEEGWEIVLLEQMEQGLNYFDYQPQKPVCLVIGNEVDGISEGLVQYCDQAIEIEMAGLKNSLNVSVAFGIIAYEMRKKLLPLMKG